mmetsp:Transcript_9612/g.25772  ORF Transcript_9612/g.25772 Transcript_9612/m.25772 type:complete len:360 (-) Transcript_9612:404-1483(-)
MVLLPGPGRVDRAGRRGSRGPGARRGRGQRPSLRRRSRVHCCPSLWAGTVCGRGDGHAARPPSGRHPAEGATGGAAEARDWQVGHLLQARRDHSVSGCRCVGHERGAWPQHAAQAHPTRGRSTLGCRAAAEEGRRRGRQVGAEGGVLPRGDAAGPQGLQGLAAAGRDPLADKTRGLRAGVSDQGDPGRRRAVPQQGRGPPAAAAPQEGPRRPAEPPGGLAPQLRGRGLGARRGRGGRRRTGRRDRRGNVAAGRSQGGRGEAATEHGAQGRREEAARSGGRRGHRRGGGWECALRDRSGLLHERAVQPARPAGRRRRGRAPGAAAVRDHRPRGRERRNYRTGRRREPRGDVEGDVQQGWR